MTTKKKTKKPYTRGPIKTYRVAVIHVLEFGCEVEVDAPSKAAAEFQAKLGAGEVQGDGYDWSRSHHTKTRLGDWAKTQVITDSEFD